MSQIYPTLWRAICIITQSVSERQGKGRVNEATHVKTVRRFFSVCALMFCTNDRCSTLLHNLITDMVDGLGGSAFLVKMLNRLGVCSSADTLARAIQYRVSERKTTKTQQQQQKVNKLEKDKNLVTKCLHRRLKWHQQTGQPLQNLAEQYILYPLPISDNRGIPLKGQKSNSTKFLEQRQKSYNPVIIINNIPLGWTPQCVVIEGMFIINTSPLGTHRAYGEYALLTL